MTALKTRNPQATGLPCGHHGRILPHCADRHLGWGTLSLINAGLAQAKGRSGLAWRLLSLLLGPLATFCIVVLPKGQPEHPP